MMTKRILLTGCAGFIGFHTALRFLQLGHVVHGVDSMKSDTEIARTMKEDRMNVLQNQSNFSFSLGCISDEIMLDGIFRHASFDYVIHLAAKAGVRSPPDAAMDYYQQSLRFWKCFHAVRDSMSSTSSMHLQVLSTVTQS